MSAIIITPRRRETHIEYRLNFDITNDGGYAFDCDKNGKVFDDLNPDALENYRWCLAHPEKFIRPAYVNKHEWSYMENAVAKCRHCNEEFELYDEYEGACECPKCGQWYNLFGQELLPPEEWEDDLEEETW